MQAQEFVELAAQVSAHAEELIAGEHRVTTARLNQYWVASKARLDHWLHDIKVFATTGADTRLTSRAQRWQDMRRVIEEILVSETLTRVWTAAIGAFDRRRQTREGEPVVRSVLTGHIEASIRALRLLVHASGAPTEDVFLLNRMRRQTERWTDLLIGYLAATHDVLEFAADRQRAEQFARDAREQPAWQSAQTAWSLLQTSLRAGFATATRGETGNEELSAQIADSVRGCFPPGVFALSGLNKSPWTTRLDALTLETQNMIEQLWTI